MRPSLELATNTSAAEKISFKLFDGQSLQYKDKTCNGMYDIWGIFSGVEENMPGGEFPSLSELRKMPYVDGEAREVIVLDETQDKRLKELRATASKLLDHSLKTAGPMKCAQELATLVAKELGGPYDHAELSAMYKKTSDTLKRRNNSLIIHLGELHIGTSRHRALLLKWLADVCDLPCRMLRGEFYLGPVGRSGEVTVVMVHFNGHEWMVELVTQPGRLFRVQSKTVPELSRTQLWDGRQARTDPGFDPQGRSTTVVRGFPTVPRNEDESSTDGATSSSSGGLKEGLAWSDLDGLTMDDLNRSDKQQGMNAAQTLAHEKQQEASSGKGFSAEERRGAEVEWNLAELQLRHKSSHSGGSKSSKESQSVSLENEMISGLGGQHSRTPPLGQDIGKTEAPSQGETGMMGFPQGSSIGDPRGQGIQKGECLPSKTASRLGDTTLRKDQRGLSLDEMTSKGVRDFKSVSERKSLSSGNARKTQEKPEASRPNSLSLKDDFPRDVAEQRSPGDWSSSKHNSESTDRGTMGSGLSTTSSAGKTLADQMDRISKANLARLREHSEYVPGKKGKKVHLSSNSTFYDMQSMASTVKDEAARTHLRETEHQSPTDVLDVFPYSTGTSSTEQSRTSFLSPSNDIEIDFAEVELGPRIGIGCFGEVFKARWRQTVVAVKRLFDQSLSQHSLKEFRAEVQLCQRLKHPNVIMFMGACTTPPNLSIMTQWAPRGSLFHLLHNTNPPRAPLTLRQKLKMALDIAKGMHYLHSTKPPIIHRDLKSMNLLVDNDLTIKVCDFGLARIRSSTWMSGKSQGGTPEWTAPEVLRNLNYNEKSDVYSYGVVLYELATGLEPWDEMTPMQVVGAVGWAGNRLQPPEDCPEIFASLMQRPSFDEIIQELIGYAPSTKSAGSND